MLRGNGGQAIFFEEEARSHLYGLIQQAVERYGHRVHGFCCMSNHIQVVMQVQDIPLSQLSIVVAYGVGETDLRGPARTRVLSEVRRCLDGWLDISGRPQRKRWPPLFILMHRPSVVLLERSMSGREVLLEASPS